MEKRVEILKLIAALGEYYDKSLTPTQLAAYSEDLMCLEPAQLGQAILIYRNDPRNDRFPLPVKLKAMIGAAVSPDDEGIQIAGRILSAIASIGPYQVQRAREAIGELGWRVVQAEGGWEALCRIENDDLPIRKAQWRNLAKSFCERQTWSPEAKQLAGNGSAKLLSMANLLPEMPKGGE